MNYKNKKILDIAQKNGFKTVKDFANLINKYNPLLKTNKHGRELLQLTLF